MKRKLQIAAAVSHGADVLLLDEPTAGLDVMARDDMLEILREYMETPGRSILISSHISTDAEGICDDIYMIDEGKILLHEETDKLLDQYGLLKVKADQYEALDKAYILAHKKEEYGYSCLTNERQYYQENYPDITIEKGKIDDVIIMMKRGSKNERIVDRRLQTHVGTKILFGNGSSYGGIISHYLQRPYSCCYIYYGHVYYVYR